MATKLASDEFLYPTTDNRPTAETDLHRRLMYDIIDRLSLFFAARDDVYVSGNLLVYFEEGNPYRVLAPDCFIVFGVKPGDRDTYKTWEEGEFPAVVFELTSASTQQEDQLTKFIEYQDTWKVREYYMFDPRGEYLDVPLQGYRLERGRFQQLKPRKGVLTSRALKITLRANDRRLVLHDAATGKELLTRAEAAEAEIARLNRELDTLRKRQSS